MNRIFSSRWLAFLLFTGLCHTARAGAQPVPTPTLAPTATPAPAATPSPTPVATPGATPAPQDPRQGDTPGQKPPVAGATPLPSPAPSPTPTGPPPPKTIEELTKGYTKVEGLFTLYTKLDGHDQKMLAEVRQDQIGPLFLLQSTYASGNGGRATAGRPARDLVWSFQRTPDDRLILSAPNLWFRSTDPNLRRAVERDFPDAYLDVFDIMARSSERKTVLIDFSSVFDGSVTGLNTAFQSEGPLRGLSDSYGLDPELSFLERIKNFPTNLVVDANFHFRRIGPPSPGGGSDTQADSRSLPIKVTFNLYGLPRTKYQPRLADPRIGYFINGQLAVGRAGFETFDDDAASDPRVTYINRWDLRKANPKAETSLPVKPIVFYLDPSIPEVYRGAVRNGILSWNRAFETAGLKNAIVVKDAPVNNWDTADMRYNTIRWVASPPSEGNAYAVALIRENPLTGEILNAGINVNSNFVRIAFLEKQEIINPLDDVRKTTGKTAKIAGNGVACQLDDEMVQNARQGFEMAQASGFPLDNKTYVNQLLREVIAHEFGHILGLRHNFVGSNWLSPAQLSDPKLVRRLGTTASVMDYVGYNVFGLKKNAPLFPTGPGKYDVWAILYGYLPTVAKTPKAEKPILERITGLSNEPGFAYQSDELSDDLDPTIVRYDLSSDPLAYAEKSFDATRELLRTLGARHPKDGQTYATFTRRLRSLVRVNARDAALAVRYVGGVVNRRVVKGASDGNVPFSSVPLAQQRRAFDILSRRIFAPGALSIPQNYLSKTEADPYNFEDEAADNAFPIREDIARVRIGTLNALFAPDRLTRMANTSWKFPGQTLSFPELFSRARSAIWGNLNSQTVLGATQRDLARAHLRLLIGMATDKVPAPADARLTAYGELQTLKKQFEAPKNGSPDAFSRLFFADTLRRVNAALMKKPE